MKHVKLIWLALIALLALAAVVAAGSAAAAEPEWGHCVPVKSKGHYEDKNCTTEDFKENGKHEKKYKGKFEWDSGSAAACYAQKKGHYKDSACTEEDFKEKGGVKSYKGKYEKTGGAHFEGNGGAAILSTVLYGCEHEGGEEYAAPRGQCSFVGIEFHPLIECTSEHNSGEAVSNDEVANVSVRFKNCTFSGAPATTPGLPAGEIQVNPLKGHIGYINKLTHQVGVLLEPATAQGRFAQFEVLGGAGLTNVGEGNATEGSFYEEAGTPGSPTGNDGILSPITPVDQMTHTFTQQFRVEETEVPCLCGGRSKDGEKLRAYVNIPSHFEGGPLERLESQLTVNEPETNETGLWSSAGQEITNVNVVEGEAEIKG